MRSSSLGLAPTSALGWLCVLVLGVAFSGCAPGGVAMQSWWGPLAVDQGPADFDDGGTFKIRGLAHRMTISGPDGEEDLLSLAFVGAEEPASCNLYSDYLRQVWDVQGFVSAMLSRDAGDRPPADEWFAYACQTLSGAAHGAFGGDGTYRALHLLLGLTGLDGAETGLGFPPACPLELDTETGECPGHPEDIHVGAGALLPGTAVVRLHERAKHGASLLPDGGSGPWTAQDLDPAESCPTILEALVAEYEAEESIAYPDSQSVAMRAAAHVYYHQWVPATELSVGGASELPGVTVGDWGAAGSVGTEVRPTVFASASRAPDIFPYSQVLLSTLGQPVDVEPCHELDSYSALVWPEVAGFFDAAAPTAFDDLLVTGGDDDDSGL